MINIEAICVVVLINLKLMFLLLV